jgi:hypothetical protein
VINASEVDPRYSVLAVHPLASFLAAARDNAGLRATYPEIRLTRAASYIGQQLEYNDDEVRSLWSRLTSDAIEEYASHPGHAQTNFSPRSVVERICEKRFPTLAP